MESDQTTGARLYMAEDDLYLAQRQLAEDLHLLEREASRLRDRVHHRLCRRPNQPVPAQARDILAVVTEFVGSVDVTGLRRQARLVEEQMARVDELQRELAAETDREPETAVA